MNWLVTVLVITYCVFEFNLTSGSDITKSNDVSDVSLLNSIELTNIAMTKLKHEVQHKEVLKAQNPSTDSRTSKSKYSVASILPNETPKSQIAILNEQLSKVGTIPSTYEIASVLPSNTDDQNEISNQLTASNLPFQSKINYQKITLKRPEGNREFLISTSQTPRNLTEIKPLHLILHGLNDNCEHFLQSSGFLELFDSFDSYVVAPCGYPGDWGAGWNAGVCCLGSSAEEVNDVEFIDEIINYMKKTYQIDFDRVFMSGFSNGAMMSERMGCESSHLIAAIASVAGVTAENPGNSEGLLTCDKVFGENKSKIAVLHIHGTSDNIVPWMGNYLLGFPSVENDMKKWAERNKCSLDKSEQTLNKRVFSNILWRKDCFEGIEIELVKAEGYGHSWPKTTEFDTAKYIVEFFKRHHLNDSKKIVVDMISKSEPPFTVVA